MDVLGYSQALLSQTSFKFTKSKKRRNNLVGIIDRLQKLEQFVMASNDIKYKLQIRGTICSTTYLIDCVPTKKPKRITQVLINNIYTFGKNLPSSKFRVRQGSLRYLQLDIILSFFYDFFFKLLNWYAGQFVTGLSTISGGP